VGITPAPPIDTGWRNQPPLDPTVRRAFLDARRRLHEQRMDTLHAATYDEHWGEIFPSHRSFVGRLLELTRAHGTVLDAPCGTGKYWPLVLDSGRTVVGIDQSAGMLRMAGAKHPSVPVGKVGLQDLAFDGLFDAVMCIDAMENIGPEDWPLVLARLRDAARPGAPLYLTVELHDEAEVQAMYASARSAGHPVVPGEDFVEGLGYQPLA
jgi:SAM-dependent methyltransferase